jgi:hypothetical protein
LSIQFGRVLAGLEPLANPTYNRVYRGDVLLEDDSIERGFIKDLDARQLANELFVSVLANRLGVRVPRAALVAVSREVSSNFSEVPHSNGNDFLAFCSIDVVGSTIAQIVAPSLDVSSLPTLRDSPWLGHLYGFDCWVANSDRHMNNILLTGAGVGFLIDHGHCFSC